MAKKIIVIGAGIIGASLAYHLAKTGAHVVVLESSSNSGGVATANSWAWINASWGNSPDYVKLRMRSMEQWRALAGVHPDLVVNWCGGLLWDLPLDELQSYIAHQQQIGYAIRRVDGGEALLIEPALTHAPSVAAYAECEGCIEPVAAARGFLNAARNLGAELVLNSTVTGLIITGGRVAGVKTEASEIHADEIVLAAGAATMGLLAPLGISLRMESPAGLLVHSKPTHKILNGLVMAPELHVRQTAEGRLVAGSDFGGTQPGDDPAATAAVLFKKVQVFLNGAEHLEMDFFTLGFRPTPADGMPAIGRPAGVDGLYVAVTHSGVTLAPIIGLLGASEILNDERDQLLKPFHPDRLRFRHDALAG